MARVRLTAPLEFNLTGYDREIIQLPAGEQDVPDVVADFVTSNPELGEVLAAAAPAEVVADFVPPNLDPGEVLAAAPAASTSKQPAKGSKPPKSAKDPKPGSASEGETPGEPQSEETATE